MGSRNYEVRAGFKVEPKRASACVVVFHEIWGLTEHTKDVCKRVGKLGFAAAAPDLFEGQGELLTPANIQAAMDVVWDLTLEERFDKRRISRVVAEKKPSREVAEAVLTLYDQKFREGILSEAANLVDETNDKFGVASTLGFSFGGGISMRVASRNKRLRSAVSFYGDPPRDEEVRRISCPVLAIYAGEDDFMNRGVSQFAETAASAGMNLTLKTFPGARHDFFDDTKKASYDPRSARDAWALTGRFLKETCSGNIAKGDQALRERTHDALKRQHIDINQKKAAA